MRMQKKRLERCGYNQGTQRGGQRHCPGLTMPFMALALGLGAVEQLEQFLKLSLSHSLCLFVCPGMYVLCVYACAQIHTFMFICKCERVCIYTQRPDVNFEWFSSGTVSLIL